MTLARAGGVRWLIYYAAALWVWLAWACMGEWLHNPDYQYGLLVLPLAAYFLAKRKPSLYIADQRGCGAAWGILLVTALLIFPVELFRLSPLYWRLLLWLIGALAAIVSFMCAAILGGRPLMRVAAFPILFALLAIPWPAFIEQRTTLPLMGGVASIVGEIILFLGMPVQVLGTTIVLPNCTIGIEEACSGLRSFQTALVIALAVGEIYFLSITRRIVLLGAAVVLAFLGNIGRTFFLTWAAMQGGLAKAGHLHDWAAWGLLLLVVISTFGIAALLRPASSKVSATSPKDNPACPALPFSRVACVWGIALAGFFLSHGWYLYKSGWRSLTATPVLVSRPEIDVIPVPPQVGGILQPTEGQYYHAQSGEGIPLSAYHFYWAPSRSTAFQVYHRPDVCMPGGGWKQIGPVARLEVNISGTAQSWYVFHYERGGIRAFLLWNTWMDGKPVDLQFDAKMQVQRNATMNFIRNGKKSVSYEAAAILIPYEGDLLPENVAAQAIRQFFTTHENPPGR